MPSTGIYGAGIGGITGLIGAGLNFLTDQQNLDHQNKIANENLALSKEQFAYQQWLNQTAMEREDTAVQRRAQDLMAAGLDPALAVGSAASSGSFSSAPAPQRQMTPKTAAFDLASAMQMADNFWQSQTDRAVAGAQVEQIKAQTKHQNLVNNWFNANAGLSYATQVATLAGIRGKNAIQDIDLYIKTKDKKYLDKYNLNSYTWDYIHNAASTWEAMESGAWKNISTDVKELASSGVTKVGDAVNVVVNNAAQAVKDAVQPKVKKKEYRDKIDDAHKNPSSPFGPGFDQQWRNAMNANF